jgi:hypothetical protein
MIYQLTLSFCLLSSGQCAPFPSVESFPTIEACSTAGEKAMDAIMALIDRDKISKFTPAGVSCRLVEDEEKE